jgi:glycosyltransferase involved in cell wall biosynthesis
MPWLQEQLDSLLAQSHGEWSLCISDDGSDDGTRAVLQAFRAQHPARVQMIIDGPGRGAAANFLHLLRHPALPNGLVALCDQDDLWLPEKLSLAVAALADKTETPAVWAARYLIADADLRRGRTSPLWRHSPSLANAVVQNILSGHTLTLNGAALRLLRRGDMPHVPHHDWWIYLLMAAAGARICVSDQIVLKYRQHHANTMGARDLGRLLRLRRLCDGTLGQWIDRNMQALAALDDHIAPDARDMVAAWGDRSLSRRRFLERFRIHRQSKVETGLLHLVATVGKL